MHTYIHYKCICKGIHTICDHISENIFNFPNGNVQIVHYFKKSTNDNQRAIHFRYLPKKDKQPILIDGERKEKQKECTGVNDLKF